MGNALFYHLTRSNAETLLPQLIGKALGAGWRVELRGPDRARLDALDQALWMGDGFLPHGLAGGAHDARQPVLLADVPDAANGARYIAMADGRWLEEALTFERAFLLFDNASIDDARGVWRTLGSHAGLERNFWRQEDGRWIKAA